MLDFGDSEFDCMSVLLTPIVTFPPDVYRDLRYALGVRFLNDLLRA